MDKKLKLNLIIVQSVIIGILILYLVFSINDSGRLRELENQTARLQDHLEKCLERNDSLSLLLQFLKIEHAVPPFLDENHLEYLRKQGMTNPVMEIRNHLIENPELIGRPGVLGGKMGFYFPDGIHILNHRWVFAYYEDGHVGGAVLLRFNISDGGEITWEVIDETSMPG
jgi:hypothetical protein